MRIKLTYYAWPDDCSQENGLCANPTPLGPGRVVHDASKKEAYIGREQVEA